MVFKNFWCTQLAYGDWSVSVHTYKQLTSFLLWDDCTIPTCFCQECRLRRKDQFAKIGFASSDVYLYYSGVWEIGSEHLFENILNQIANDKAYHDPSLLASGLKKWILWAKKQGFQIWCLRGSLCQQLQSLWQDGMTL